MTPDQLVALGTALAAVLTALSRLARILAHRRR